MLSSSPARADERYFMRARAGVIAASAPQSRPCAAALNFRRPALRIAVTKYLT